MRLSPKHHAFLLTFAMACLCAPGCKVPKRSYEMACLSKLVVNCESCSERLWHFMHVRSAVPDYFKALSRSEYQSCCIVQVGRSCVQAAAAALTGRNGSI